MSKPFGFMALGLGVVAALGVLTTSRAPRLDASIWKGRIDSPKVADASDASEGTDVLPHVHGRQRLPLAAGSASLPTVDEIEHDPTLVYRQEIALLRKRIAWLETELDLCGSEVTRGPIGRWLATLRPEERPEPATLRLVAEYLRAYPVELAPEEGLWVAERIAADDWTSFADTTDEALIRFLGPERLMRDLPADLGAALRADWIGEGLFR